MHPQFSRLVDTIVRYGYTWGFVSNGQRTEPYLTSMKKHKENFSSVNLSIDSAIPEIHNQLRMKKGAFDEVVNSARKYVEEGFVLRVNSSLNKRTKTEVKALIELAENLGAAGIKFAGIILGEQNKHLGLSDEESLALYREIISQQENSKIKIETTSSLYTRGGGYFCQALSLNALTINSKGELTFCCDIQKDRSIIGPLKGNSLSDLIKKWLEQSARLQAHRAERIKNGIFGEHFDTCTFCNQYFTN